MGGNEGLVRGMLTRLGEGAESRTGRPQGSHLVTIQVSLVPSEQRDLSADEFADLWLSKVPTLAGVDNLSLKTQVQGPRAGVAVDVQMSSNNLDMLAQASAEMADVLKLSFLTRY